MKTLLKLGAVGVVILALAAWKTLHDAGRRSDRSACRWNQRCLHTAAKVYREKNKLNDGDPLDWSKVIGPGLLVTKRPICPVHGESAYVYPPVVPESGILAAPCQDPEHRQTDPQGW
jgi:hypothetical protein